LFLAVKFGYVCLTTHSTISQLYLGINDGETTDL